LRAIANQIESVFEVIVIDDASEDGSMAIVEAFVKEVAVPIRLIHTEGVGQSAARNAGAQLASGDYLAFLDQDDVWLDGHVAGLTRCLDDNPASSMVYSDVNTIDADSGLLLVGLNAQADNSHPKRSVNEIIAADIMALPSATMVRRIAFLDLGGFDPALQGYEDDDLYFGGSGRAGTLTTLTMLESITEFTAREARCHRPSERVGCVLLKKSRPVPLTILEHTRTTSETSSFRACGGRSCWTIL